MKRTGQCPACRSIYELDDIDVGHVMECQCEATLFVADITGFSEIPVLCSQCDGEYVVDRDGAGETVECECGAELIVPDVVMRLPVLNRDGDADQSDDDPGAQPTAPELSPGERLIDCPQCENQFVVTRRDLGIEAECECGCIFTAEMDKAKNLRAVPRDAQQARSDSPPADRTKRESKARQKSKSKLVTLAVAAVALLLVFSIAMFVMRKNGMLTAAKTPPPAKPVAPPPPIQAESLVIAPDDQSAGDQSASDQSTGDQSTGDQSTSRIHSTAASATATAGVDESGDPTVSLKSPDDMGLQVTSNPENNRQQNSKQNSHSPSVSPQFAAPPKKDLPQAKPARPVVPIEFAQKFGLTFDRAFREAFAQYEITKELQATAKASDDNTEYHLQLAKTISLLQQTLAIGGHKSNGEQLREVRYLLTYLMFQAGRLAEAGIMAESVAWKLPEPAASNQDPAEESPKQSAKRQQPRAKRTPATKAKADKAKSPTNGKPAQSKPAKGKPGKATAAGNKQATANDKPNANKPADSDSKAATKAERMERRKAAAARAAAKAAKEKAAAKKSAGELKAEAADALVKEALMIGLAAMQEASATHWASPDGVGELYQMEKLVSIFAQRWPSDPQVDAMRMNLAQSYDRFNRPQKAAIAYAAISKKSPYFQAAQLAAGSALWTEYRNVAARQDATPAELKQNARLRQHARKLLTNGIDLAIKADPQPRLPILVAKLSLARLELSSENLAAAEQVLTQPPMAITDSITAKQPSESQIKVSPNFVRLVFETLYSIRSQQEDAIGASSALTGLASKLNPKDAADHGKMHLMAATNYIGDLQLSETISRKQCSTLARLIEPLKGDNTTLSPANVLWLGEAWSQLAARAENAEVTTHCFAKAADAYEIAMARTDFPKSNRQGALLRHAQLLRGANRISEATALIGELLESTPNAFGLQIEAAEALQATAISENRPLALIEAVNGPADSPIWGWNKLVTTLHTLKYSDHADDETEQRLFKSQYNLAKCQWLIAQATSDPAEKAERMTRLNKLLKRLSITIPPTAQPWASNFNALIQQIAANSN